MKGDRAVSRKNVRISATMKLSEEKPTGISSRVTLPTLSLSSIKLLNNELHKYSCLEHYH